MHFSTFVLLLIAHAKCFKAQTHIWNDPRLPRSYDTGRDYSYAAYGVASPKYYSVGYQPNYPMLMNYQRPTDAHWPQQNYQAPRNNAQPYNYPPYYQPQQRASAPTAELAKYRYEGNYIQRIPGPIPAPASQQIGGNMRPELQRRLGGEFLQQPPVSFANAVLHVEPAVPSTALRPDYNDAQANYRLRRYPKDTLAAPSVKSNNTEAPSLAQQARTTPQETRYFHDIYQRFAEPNTRSFGHVELQPEQSMRRFETQRGNQRFKGEVIWADKAGGYGSHHWDLAQGKL